MLRLDPLSEDGSEPGSSQPLIPREPRKLYSKRCLVAFCEFPSDVLSGVTETAQAGAQRPPIEKFEKLEIDYVELALPVQEEREGGEAHGVETCWDRRPSWIWTQLGQCRFPARIELRETSTHRPRRWNRLWVNTL